MNPWIQSKKYFNDCIFIKTWIPDLKQVNNDHIHKWYDYYDKYDIIYSVKPIVNYDTQKKIMLNL